ncbi:hypothetical protein C5S42_09335 [Candidatus Methanomarinus sp.]|nr:hypothetical protein C5S42_09335 [ANME-2 cluster archaeon]
MNVFKVCVFYIIVYINLLKLNRIYMMLWVLKVPEVERDVISRENRNYSAMHKRYR